MDRIEIRLQLALIARLPITLVADQDDIWLELANAGRLHQGPRARIERFAIDNRVESLDFVAAHPGARLPVQRQAVTLRHPASHHVAANHQRQIFRQQIGKVD